jgi:uncharacterized protein YndB with AHSA1/START domain
MPQQNSPFSAFKLRVNINTTIERAYQAWATRAGIESWFLRQAIFKDASGKDRTGDMPIQESDSYTWRWHGYPDDVAEKGKVLKANGKNLFSFTFSMGCPVTVSIYTELDQTIVELVESNLPTDEETIKKHYVGDSRGWIFYLANLKSILEGGLDLRNKNDKIMNVITA